MQLPRFHYSTSASLGPGIDVGGIVQAATGRARGLERVGNALAEWDEARTKTLTLQQTQQGELDLMKGLGGLYDTAIKRPSPDNRPPAGASADASDVMPAIGIDARKPNSNWYAENAQKWLTKDYLGGAGKDYTPDARNALMRHGQKLIMQHAEKLQTKERQDFIDGTVLRAENVANQWAALGDIAKAEQALSETRDLIGQKETEKLRQGAWMVMHQTGFDGARDLAGLDKQWSALQLDIANGRFAPDAAQAKQLRDAFHGKQAELEKRATTLGKQESAAALLEVQTAISEGKPLEEVQALFRANSPRMAGEVAYWEKANRAVEALREDGRSDLNVVREFDQRINEASDNPKKLRDITKAVNSAADTNREGGVLVGRKDYFRLSDRVDKFLQSIQEKRERVIREDVRDARTEAKVDKRIDASAYSKELKATLEKRWTEAGKMQDYAAIEARLKKADDPEREMRAIRKDYANDFSGKPEADRKWKTAAQHLNDLKLPGISQKGGVPDFAGTLATLRKRQAGASKNEQFVIDSAIHAIGAAQKAWNVYRERHDKILKEAP